MSGFPIAAWREILHERASEAVEAIGELDGVVDVVLGGSIGRGDEWAFSDVDLIPITTVDPSELQPKFVAVRNMLGLQWASTGLSHVVDVGRLAFTKDEVSAVLEGGGEALVPKLADPRWLYGSDKAAGGRGRASDGPGSAFASFAAATRFDPAVRRARFDSWMTIIDARLERASNALSDGRAADAHAALQVGGPLSAATLEAWGEREAGLARFASRFERIAEARGLGDLAAEIGAFAGSSVEVILNRRDPAPAWLEARIELGYLARLDVGELVTVDENRRDHLILFSHLDPPVNPIPASVADAEDRLAWALRLATRVRSLI